MISFEFISWTISACKGGMPAEEGRRWVVAYTDFVCPLYWPESIYVRVQFTEGAKYKYFTSWFRNRWLFFHSE